VLIPGSFDPLHLGHIDVVDQAVELFGDVVLGILVNFDKPSGLFSPDERVALAEASLAGRPGVSVRAFGGLAVQAAADADADFIVKGLRNPSISHRAADGAHESLLRRHPHRFCLPTRPRVRVESLHP
jgi:pantetheine-phosphate adenylyltransferase